MHLITYIVILLCLHVGRIQVETGRVHGLYIALPGRGYAYSNGPQVRNCASDGYSEVANANLAIASLSSELARHQLHNEYRDWNPLHLRILDTISARIALDSEHCSPIIPRRSRTQHPTQAHLKCSSLKVPPKVHNSPILRPFIRVNCLHSHSLRTLKT